MSRPQANGSLPLTKSTYNHSSITYKPYKKEPEIKLAKNKTFELQGKILELLEDNKLLIVLNKDSKKVLLEQGYHFYRASYENYPEGDDYVEVKITQELIEHYANVGFKNLFGLRTMFIRLQHYDYIDFASQKRLKGVVLHVKNIDRPRFQHHSTSNFY